MNPVPVPSSCSAADQPPLSIKGKQWIFPTCAQRDILALMQGYSLSEMTARILVGRRYTAENAVDMLSPSLKKMLPNPSILKDMDKAAERVARAIVAHEKIAVFGDYDVDGATSSALLRRYFNLLRRETRLYIPDRIEEGYGPSVDAMDTLHKEGINVIIMVDCGTLSFGPLSHGRSLGLDVIVLDHHMSEVKLPEAYALVNPNRVDETHAVPYLRELCAAGVAFLFLIALQRTLREKGFFQSAPENEKNNRQHIGSLESKHNEHMDASVEEPDLRLLLDLVALGTVCDVMPLTHLNRVFVKHGLSLLERRINPGLTALMDVSGVNGPLSAYHLGFIMGPRVNAGGRVGTAWYGSEMLTTDDRLYAREIAQKLNVLNQERQTLEAKMVEEAFIQVETKNLYDKPILLLQSDTWHPGVIGIVASRLTERFQKPTLVVSTMFGVEGKGSGRSIATVNLGSLMHKAVSQNLLIKGGGHPMAAGFTLSMEYFDKFYAFLCVACKDSVHAHQPELSVEGWLSISALNREFIADLNLLEPFGQGHETPRFALKNMDVVFAEIFGETHVRLALKDETGATLRGVSFRAVGSPMGDFLLTRPKNISVVGTLKEDIWNGKSTLSFTVVDVM